MTKAFLIISLIVALICAFFTAMPLWLAVLMLPLCFIALLLPLVVMIIISAAQADTSKPIEKRSPLSRLSCIAIADLLCTLGMLKTELSGFEKLPRVFATETPFGMAPQPDSEAVCRFKERIT